MPPEGPDVLNRSSLSATGRVLADLCARRACRAITSRPLHDLRELVRRTGRRALDGWVNGPRGRRVRAELDARSGSSTSCSSGDVNPALRAELPGRDAQRPGRRPAPILRLGARAGARSAFPSPRAQAAVDENDSDALFLATRCEESLFPWPRAAAPALRIDRAIAAARAIPPAQLGPFTWTVALASEAILPCLAWPNAAPAPAPPGPLPAVPTLLLSGRADLRTPLEDAARGRGADPRRRRSSRLPFTGHSVLGQRPLEVLARTRWRRFFAGAAGRSPAARSRERVPPVAPAPRAAERPRRVAARRRGR